MVGMLEMELKKTSFTSDYVLIYFFQANNKNTGALGRTFPGPQSVRV